MLMFKFRIEQQMISQCDVYLHHLCNQPKMQQVVMVATLKVKLDDGEHNKQNKDTKLIHDLTETVNLIQCY